MVYTTSPAFIEVLCLFRANWLRCCGEAHFWPPMLVNTFPSRGLVQNLRVPFKQSLTKREWWCGGKIDSSKIPSCVSALSVLTLCKAQLRRFEQQSVLLMYWRKDRWHAWEAQSPKWRTMAELWVSSSSQVLPLSTLHIGPHNIVGVVGRTPTNYLRQSPQHYRTHLANRLILKFSLVWELYWKTWEHCAGHYVRPLPVSRTLERTSTPVPPWYFILTSSMSSLFSQAYIQPVHFLFIFVQTLETVPDGPLLRLR